MDAYDVQAESGAKHDPSSLDDTSVQTITASSVNALPNVEVQSNHSGSQYDRPTTSYSDTGFARSPYASYSADNTPEQPHRTFAPSHAQDDRHRYDGNASRPSSRLSRQNSDYDPQPAQQQQQQQQQGQRQQAQKNASVVIKVGMVGDAQIGKTSLMVKYVEGSWDEDYIQTLGKQFSNTSTRE